jgi:hypothetical protein
MGFDPWNRALKIWESIWECEGLFSHSLCTPGSMWCDFWVFPLARNLTTPCLGREPKARVVIECVKDFRSGYCGNTIFDSLGVLNWMCNMFIKRREFLLDSGSYGDFGNKEILESIINHNHHLYP